MDRREQDAIQELVMKLSGCPDVDGSGCDSGDPLDLTLTEISIGFNYIENRLYDVISAARPGFQWPEGKSAVDVAIELINGISIKEMMRPTSDLRPCDPAIFERPGVAIITGGSAKLIERFVRELAEYSGEPVDWHYVAGRGVVKTTGDRDKVLDALLHVRLHVEPCSARVTFPVATAEK